MERRPAEVGQVSVRRRGERARRQRESVEGRHQGVQLHISRGLRGHQRHHPLRRQDILDTAHHFPHLV